MEREPPVSLQLLPVFCVVVKYCLVLSLCMSVFLLCILCLCQTMLDWDALC
jgi:hypothetical protein